MVMLEYLCSQAENCCGGDLLNTIHHVATTRGNQVSAPLFDFLLQKVAPRHVPLVAELISQLECERVFANRCLSQHVSHVLWLVVASRLRSRTLQCLSVGFTMEVLKISTS